MTHSQRRAAVRLDTALHDTNDARLRVIRNAVENGRLGIAYFLVATAPESVRALVPARVVAYLAKHVESGQLTSA